MAARPLPSDDEPIDLPEETTSRRRTVQWVGLLGGPVLAVLAYLLLPDTYTAVDGTVAELGHAGRATAAIGVLMATWWMTEAIEISATALLPIALLPLAQAAPIGDATAPYANPLVFLFLGGFLLALAMQRWGLERRIARRALRLAGTEPRRLIGAFMVITAVFSMWVSNTATAAMMLPVALSVIDAGVPGGRARLAGASGVSAPGHSFATGLLLAIAVSASIGGVGTLIGTPPNLFLASFVEDNLGVEIGFAQWLLLGLPLVVVFLPIAWLLVTRVLFPPDLEPGALDGALAADEDEAPMSTGEWATFVVFSLTVTAWVLRPVLEDLTIGGAQPFAGLTDPGIAIAAGLALFVIPVDRRRRIFVLDWPTAKQLPWGILLLFGGGLSLAAAVEANGVAEYLGAQADGLDVLPPLLVVAAVIAAVVFLTEMTSNTATAAALIPVLTAVAPGLGLSPLALVVPCAIAASLAFMLPVATPPNAVVFGSGYVAMPEMMRLGLRLNLVSIVVVTAATYLLAGPVLGFDLPVW